MTEKFSLDVIETWLVNYIAKVLEQAEDEIDVEASFDTFGLESSSVAAMTGDLADWLGQDLDPTMIFEYPTISALAKQLSLTLCNDAETAVV